MDEGTKAIAVCQKHIRITDWSDLGWAVVEAYMDDELVSNSDDERKLYKASQEAQQTEEEEGWVNICGGDQEESHTKRRTVTPSWHEPEV